MASLSALVPLLYFPVSTFFVLMALNASQPCRPALLGVVIAFAILAFRHITDLTDAADRASIIFHTSQTRCVCVEKHVLPRRGRSWD